MKKTVFLLLAVMVKGGWTFCFWLQGEKAVPVTVARAQKAAIT